MPFKIEQRGNKWAVIKKSNGEVKSTHDTRAKAVANMRLRYHVEGGGKLTK